MTDIINPHQAEIDKLAARVLPRVREMDFATNTREPWLGNPVVDKAVMATIETCFALADEDRKAGAQPQVLPAGQNAIDTTAEEPKPSVHEEPNLKPEQL